MAKEIILYNKELSTNVKSRKIPKSGQEILDVLIESSDRLEQKLLQDGKPNFGFEDSTFRELFFTTLKEMGYNFEKYPDDYQGSAFRANDFWLNDSLKKSEFIPRIKHMDYIDMKYFDTMDNGDQIACSELYLAYDMTMSYDHFSPEHLRETSARLYSDKIKQTFRIEYLNLLAKCKGMRDMDKISQQIIDVLTPNRKTPADPHQYFMYGGHLPYDLFTYKNKFFRLFRESNPDKVDGEHFSTQSRGSSVHLYLGKSFTDVMYKKRGKATLFAYTLFKENNHPLLEYTANQPLSF